jgi:GST-like protein
MLKIFDLDTSPACLTTKILLKELAIPYEEQWVTRAELREGDYRAQFPLGQAPAIQDGDLRLAESGAIALYLAHQHGRLIPQDPARRALMFQAMFVEASLLVPAIGAHGLFGELYKPEAERSAARIAEFRERTMQVGRVLGQLLGDQEFFAGELSLADIQLYAAVSKSLANGAFGDAPQNLVRWCERMSARPAVQAARQDYVHYRVASAA